MPASLVQSVRSRYLECVTSVQPASGWKLLVLDTETQGRIQSLLKMYDILEHGVQQVELIGNQRTPFPRLEAVYILTPTPENVSRVIKDFEPARPAQPASKKAPAQPATAGPKYAAAHVFFINSLHDRDLERLADSPAGSYLKTLKEIYVDFTPLEAQVFSVQFPEAFWTLYSPSAFKYRDAIESWEASLDAIAGSIINTCATLNEMPDIRYYAPEASGRPALGPAKGQHPTSVLAKMVDSKLKAYARDNPEYQATVDGKPKSTLLITDRSMDLMAPLLHEFTYQAMCNDLLSIDGGQHYHHTFRNEQGALEEIDAVLNDDDKVWCDIRHMHMKDALDTLVAAFKQFNAEHGGPSGSSINDLKDMLANLPGMKDSKEKLSLHLSMAEQCMELFEARKLSLAANVEQSCATGMTAEGKTPKTLVEEMVPLLGDPSISRSDKVRIIALYVMHRDGVPEEDRKRLYQHARLGMSDIDALNHLVHLGQEVSKENKSKKKTLFKQTLRDDAYDISRYQPALKLMVEEQIAGKLDPKTFPYINPPLAAATGGSLRSGNVNSSAPTAAPTSLRSARPRWTAGAKSFRANEPRQRLLVFVAGGMTYSEIRTVYQVSEANNKDIYLGSTHVFTPDSFIEELATIERPTASLSRSRAGGAASAAPSMRSDAGSSRPMQPSQSQAPARPMGQGPRLNQPQQQQQYRDAYGGGAPPPPPPQQQPRPTSAGAGRYGQWQDDRGPSSNGGHPSRPGQQQQSMSSGSYGRGLPPHPQQAQQPPPPNRSYNSSIADQDFVPNLQPGAPMSRPSSSASTGGPRPMGSTTSLNSSVAGDAGKPKKKGLFGKLR